MDARHFTSAVGNGFSGGGRENPDHYPNASISYMSLGNIHDIASSHKALLKAVSTQADSPNWYSVIESTGWLTHVASVLKSAAGRDGVVGKMLEENSSVLVHCTDGWDRTTQLVSLAQIIMDPYYRTVHGFRVLIEKEWISCGHPFHSRTEAVPSQKKSNVSTMEEGSAESWKSDSNAIHSSPNGAKESLSYSRKWFNRVYGEQDSRLDPKPIPPFSYHMDIPQQHQQEQKSKHESASSYANYPPTESMNSHQARGPPAFQEQAAPQQRQTTSTPVNSQMVPLSPSPVFLLFLTCVHHIVQQYPDQFEFNDYLLLVLARAASGFSPFGDFLFNSERERAQERLRERSPSVWKWIQRNRGWFTNRDFIPDSAPLDRSSWRESVLHVQTGGRYTTLWSEYYFNTTPIWFPDPRTVLSTPLYLFGKKEREAYEVSRRQAGDFSGSWCSSRFDQAQLQLLALPGLPPQQHSRPQSSQEHPETRVTTIPPGLALLRGQEMYTYYMLAQHLRVKRRRQVERAFLGWRDWIKQREESRSAQDAGWVMSNVSGESSSQEDTGFDNRNDGSGKDDDESSGSDGQGRGKGVAPTKRRLLKERSNSNRRTPPQLKIVAARKGIQTEMERIIEGGPFFGEGPIKYEDETGSEGDEDEDMEEGLEVGLKLAVGTRMPSVRDVRLRQVIDQEDLDESFDDFGFPVGVVQTDAVQQSAVAKV
ncbi:Myotubularin- protein 3 [Linnemannia zychae]|nr:Myotubularin- protein 3 [Linnemannia zychae]